MRLGVLFDKNDLGGYLTKCVVGGYLTKSVFGRATYVIKCVGPFGRMHVGEGCLTKDIGGFL